MRERKIKFILKLIKLIKVAIKNDCNWSHKLKDNQLISDNFWFISVKNIKFMPEIAFK